jgi:hypothetical protein
MNAHADSSDETSSEEDFKNGVPEEQGVRVTLDDQQMNTAQKLLLFWRKPAVSPSPLIPLTNSDVVWLVVAKMLVGRRRGGDSGWWRVKGDEQGEGLGTKSLDIGIELGESF